MTIAFLVKNVGLPECESPPSHRSCSHRACAPKKAKSFRVFMLSCVLLTLDLAWFYTNTFYTYITMVDTCKKQNITTKITSFSIIGTAKVSSKNELFVLDFEQPNTNATLSKKQRKSKVTKQKQPKEFTINLN